MSFPRYGKYKDSGVEWLGEVPADWDVARLKRVAKLQSGEAITAERIEDEGQYPVFGGNGLRGYTASFTHNGDYALIGRQGALCGNVNYATGKFWASEHAVVVTPLRAIHLKWLGELLRAMDLNQYSVTAAQPGLSVDAISNLRVPVPPQDQQHAIAVFLDRETAKIDGLIAEQRRLIDLLKEKRQAVITHVVTEGLDPTVAFRESGVLWLKRVPAHWEQGPVKRWLKTISGGTPDTGLRELYYTESAGHPWIRTTDLNDGILSENEVNITDAALAASVCQLLPKDSVLVAMYGGDGSIGKHALLAMEACINQAVCALLPNEDAFDPGYLFRYVQFYRPHWMFGAESSRKDPNISQSLIRNAPLLRPPLDEQRRIASFLDNQTGKFDLLMAEAQRAIDLLDERRSALISAAVTGQIDVRGAVSTEEALAQSRADIAAGRFVVESAAAHMARLEGLLASAEEPRPADLA